MYLSLSSKKLLLGHYRKPLLVKIEGKTDYGYPASIYTFTTQLLPLMLEKHLRRRHGQIVRARGSGRLLPDSEFKIRQGKYDHEISTAV